MKFPKLFGKKAASVDEFDDDEAADGEAVADDRPATPEEGADDEDADDGDFEDDAGRGPGRRKLLLLAGALLVLGIGGGGTWWWLGDDLPGLGSLTRLDPYRIILDLPPRPGDAPPDAGAPNALAELSDGSGEGIVVTPVTLATFAELPTPPVSPPLVPAPDPALVEQSPQGPLPRIGDDGRVAWQVYARPFPPGDPRPRVAVIVTGLGLSRDATQAAIQYLPAAVTLAFDPYAENLQEWVAGARHHGHEVLLGLPMESAEFPARDPGPRALVSAIGPADNLRRMNYLLSRMSGYVGVVSQMGSQLTVDEIQMGPMLDALGRRGLLYIDSGASRKTVAPDMAKQVGMPHAVADMKIDQDPSRAAITRRLTELEDLTRKNGMAVGLARPLPVTVERLVAWAAALEGRDIVLAPVSAVTAITRMPAP